MLHLMNSIWFLICQQLAGISHCICTILSHAQLFSSLFFAPGLATEDVIFSMLAFNFLMNLQLSNIIA